MFLLLARDLPQQLRGTKIVTMHIIFERMASEIESDNTFDEPNRTLFLSQGLGGGVRWNLSRIIIPGATTPSGESFLDLVK